MKLFLNVRILVLVGVVYCLSVFDSFAGYDPDSLLLKIEQQPEDTSKVKSLLLISGEYVNNDPNKAMKYAIRAYDLSSKLKFATGIIDAILLKSNIYTITGQFDSALIFSRKATHLSDSTGDEKRLADSYLNHGRIIFRTEGHLPARNYYLKAFSIYKEIGDSSGYMNSLNSLGIVYMRQAEYDSAILFFLDYLKLCEKLNNEEGLGKGYVNLGISYYELLDFSKARYYFLESIQINIKYNNVRFLSIANNNLGNISYDEGKYDEALKFYNICLDQNNKTNNISGLANVNNNIGNIYEKLKDYNKALVYYNSAKDFYEKAGYIDGLIAAYKNIGLIYERRKNYKEALKIYDSCLVIARLTALPNRIIEVLYNIHKTYELMGDFEKAYKIQTEQVALKDSIFNVEKNETITNLQLKYEKEKDQGHILLLENENLSKGLELRKRTNQRNIYMFTGFGSIVVILFAFGFYRHKTRKDKIIAEQKIRQLEDEKKFFAARAIVEGQEVERKRIAKELHDGLGVLLSTAKMQFSAIKDKSPENRPLIERATKLLEQATGDVRKISHNMMPGLLTKFGLFEALEDLFDNLNDLPDLTARIEIIGETVRFSENKEIMLYRILQEMVNNTLKHANAGKVFLRMEILPKLLKINYSDDGKGFDLDKTLESKSLGLTSIQSRVGFLQGDLKIDSKLNEGVKYDFEIPVEPEKYNKVEN